MSRPPGQSPSGETLARLLAATPGELDRFAAACEACEDWDGVMTEAIAQGVHGILSHYVSACGVELEPEVASRVERQQSYQAIWQEHLWGALGEALRALDDAGVRAASLKGPVLAHRLYPGPHVRPSVDIDLLVADAETGRAVEALERAGYAAVVDATQRYHRRRHHHIHLVHERGVTVELHFRAHSGFGTVIPSEALLERASPLTTPSGARTWVLSPEDEVLYLLVHAVRHCEVQLGWLYDVKLLVERTPGLDWGLVAARAGEWRVSRALGLGLEDLSLAFGAPPGAAARVEPWRSRAANRIRRVLAASRDAETKSHVATLLYGALLCDTAGLAASSLAQHLTRIARRRAHGWFPRLTPDDWSG